MTEPTEAVRSADPYTPAEMARLVQEVRIRKAEVRGFKIFVLAILAGVFIPMGAMLYTITVAGAGFGFVRRA